MNNIFLLLPSPVFLLLQGSDDFMQPCPPIQLPLYAEFPVPCYNTLGYSCHLGCQEGFELIGSCHRKCCLDGTWTGFPPKCISIYTQTLLVVASTIFVCSYLSPPNDCFSGGEGIDTYMYAICVGGRLKGGKKKMELVFKC